MHCPSSVIRRFIITTAGQCRLARVESSGRWRWQASVRRREISARAPGTARPACPCSQPVGRCTSSRAALQYEALWPAAPCSPYAPAMTAWIPILHPQGCHVHLFRTETARLQLSRPPSSGSSGLRLVQNLVLWQKQMRNHGEHSAILRPSIAYGDGLSLPSPT